MNFTALPLSPLGEFRLRHLTRGDLPAWFGYLSRPEVFEHTSWNVLSPEALLPFAWDPALDSPDRLNERSRRVLERCGFRKEGLLRSYRMVGGTPRDFFMYAHVARPRST